MLFRAVFLLFLLQNPDKNSIFCEEIDPEPQYRPFYPTLSVTLTNAFQVDQNEEFVALNCSYAGLENRNNSGDFQFTVSSVGFYSVRPNFTFLGEFKRAYTEPTTYFHWNSKTLTKYVNLYPNATRIYTGYTGSDPSASFLVWSQRLKQLHNRGGGDGPLVLSFQCAITLAYPNWDSKDGAARFWSPEP